jgi:serine/threonine protein phosphatase PrpC
MTNSLYGNRYMLPSIVATLHDNSAHGDDGYVVRTLGDGWLLDAVMDGVTGRRGSDASRAVAEALSTALPTSADDLVAILEDVNLRLYQRGWGRFFLTTISAAFCQGSQLSVIGAGDSPVFLIRADTIQHLCTHVKGFVRGGVVQAIGMQAKLDKLYRAEVTLMPGDRLVLLTDGITENIPPNEVAHLVRHAASPDDVVTQLHTIMTTRRAASQRGVVPSEGFKDDDWTVIVRFFG